MCAATSLYRKHQDKLRKRKSPLSQLRPRGLSYAVVPGETFADDMTGEEQEFAANVCEAVERHVVSLRLFGDSQVECSPDGTAIRQNTEYSTEYRRQQSIFALYQGTIYKLF
eukprot:COSAG02_NODE_22668_length_744_cov_1.711628_1_plen_112_part_00